MADDSFVERTIGDWTAYQDEDTGGVYYYNDKTEESRWDPSPGFEDDATAGEAAADDGDDDGARGGDVNEAEAAGAQTPPLDGVGAQTPPFEGAQTPPPMDDDDKSDGITKSPPAFDGDDDGITQSPPPPDEQEEAEQDNEQGGGDAIEEEEIADGTEIGGGWVAYNNEGQIYFYNAETGETQWERPNLMDESTAAPKSPTDDVPDQMKGKDEDEALNSPQKKEAWPDDDEDVDKMDLQPTSPTTLPPEDEPKQEEIDTAATAETFLNQPDAVMEPNALDHINILVQKLGPQVAGPKAMQSLMNGYSGGTAICGLMGLWLAELKSLRGAGTNSDSSLSDKKKGAMMPNTTKEDTNGLPKSDSVSFRDGANDARDVVEEVINRLAKERFTKDYGDTIVKLSKKEAAFIDKMIQSERWRKLLIDLSATNKDSKLFMYCLQSISNLGHHRAIANRINQSDYFGVFNSMLQSELAIAAQIAVDGYTKEVMDSMESTNSRSMDGNLMGGLIADLRRTCTSTSYTYLYAMEVLQELIMKSRKLLSPSGDGSTHNPESLKRAIRKWERLREELEDEMLKPLKTGTTFQRKRRVDVALTMSDLFQRKRRRVDPRLRVENGNENGATDSFGNNNNSNNLADMLDSALCQLLTKNSLGSQVDKEIAENILKYAYGGSTDRIGDLLIKHPTAITALLQNLFGKKRIRQLEARLKCARLVALAVTASERHAKLEMSADQAAGIIMSNEDALSQAIVKASQLCEQLENMVSFTVLDNVVDSDNSGTVGRQLCAMCIQHAAVSQGVLIWIKELASGPDFVIDSNYPTISPCILSLARLICRNHPLTRPAILEISLVFMGHSNREISHQKMSSIKEQCVRLMLWLSTQGLSLSVISAVQSKLERGGSSELDSSLIRYFFAGMLEIVRPPLSLAFVRALGELMLKRPCVDALQSRLFDDSSRKQIVQLVAQFEATGDAQRTDKSLLSMLKSTYCPSN